MPSTTSPRRIAWIGGTVHSIEAIEDSVVVEVSTPQLDDVVRLQDRYGRSDDQAPVEP